MERREDSRFFVGFEIEIKEAGGSFSLRGVTTDVSLGGCYVAAIFPLAVGSQIHFTMRVADENVKGRGSVQTSHPGVGMASNLSTSPAKTDSCLTNISVPQSQPHEKAFFNLTFVDWGTSQAH